MMNITFAIALNLSPLTLIAIAISVIGFVVMFGIASAKGGYEDLIKKTLENDAIQRNQIKKNK